MMEASFDTEESFDDPSCLAPQPPGSVSPARRQIREVKETKITVSTPELQLHSSSSSSSSSAVSQSLRNKFLLSSVDILFMLTS